MRRMQRSFFFALSCASLSLASIVVSCAGSSEARAFKAPDPTRVEAHSAGLVPSRGAIKVVLTRASGIAGAEAAADLFRFVPPISGKARWEDERTLSFSPDMALAQGKNYRVEVDLGAISGAAPGSDYFSFDLRAAGQRVSLRTLPPRVARDGSVSVQGSLELAEGVTPAAAEKALSASSGFLSWRHESERLHRFTVSGIAAGKRPRALSLAWDGRTLGSSGRGKEEVKLPSAASFEFLSARSLDEESGSRGLELAFSKPLDRAQDLRGLLSVEGVEDLRYTVAGSTVSLYSESWPALAKLRVERGLKDSSGAFIAEPASATVAFDWEKPATRFLTKGNILPTSQGLVLPIETMNLSGVIVEALRVYGDNMLQFLQVNDLDSSRELKRVGEVVWRKDFELGWKDEWKNRWMRQGLDLGPLLASQKDGMFQIRVTFRKADIRYVCPNNHDFKDLRFPDDRVMDRDDGENSFWNYVQEWADGYDEYYKYKDDPCHPAYYLTSYDRDITIRRNVVVSDIGAALKRESDGTWHAAASDLRSARPLEGATVSLYDFRRRLVASGLTGSSGLLSLNPSSEPSFATLSKGVQTSWLKVDEGSSLAVGHFDVGGEKADSGLKGFLYGERGVWRPGDEMHLVFILNDRSGKLPSSYPVSFELEDPLGRVVRTGTYTDSVNGFYSIDVATSQDAATGTYVARVKAGRQDLREEPQGRDHHAQPPQDQPRLGRDVLPLRRYGGDVLAGRLVDGGQGRRPQGRRLRHLRRGDHELHDPARLRLRRPDQDGFIRPGSPLRRAPRERRERAIRPRSRPG